MKKIKMRATDFGLLNNEKEKGVFDYINAFNIKDFLQYVPPPPPAVTYNTYAAIDQGAINARNEIYAEEDRQMFENLDRVLRGDEER